MLADAGQAFDCFDFRGTAGLDEKGWFSDAVFILRVAERYHVSKTLQ